MIALVQELRKFMTELVRELTEVMTELVLRKGMLEGMHGV
jgi:hypothetical protein